MVFVLVMPIVMLVAVTLVAPSPVTEDVPPESFVTEGIGGVPNRPTGNVTVAEVGVLADVGVIVTLPVAATPVMVPSGLNVSGPHLPDPSPLTWNVDEAEAIEDGVAAGYVFPSAGASPVF